LSTDEKKNFINNDAVLCGKYISPLPPLTRDNNPQVNTWQRYVIGATHEFKSTPLNSTEVTEELRSRTYQLAPHLWDKGEVDKITNGVRMQSHRGANGRMPIIGQYNSDATESELNHEHMWLFTGLSSRGLIYHGLFGKWLANAVLHDNEALLHNDFESFDWWRHKKEK
jgi:glycine/D-amino acid oxidase-like deaminating enzyme